MVKIWEEETAVSNFCTYWPIINTSTWTRGGLCHSEPDLRKDLIIPHGSEVLLFDTTVPMSTIHKISCTLLHIHSRILLLLTYPSLYLPQVSSFSLFHIPRSVDSSGSCRDLYVSLASLITLKLRPLLLNSLPLQRQQS